MNENHFTRMVPAQSHPALFDLLPVRLAARYARVHEQTIYRRARKGLLTLYGFPGCYRVSVAELLPKVHPGSSKLKEHGAEG